MLVAKNFQKSVRGLYLGNRFLMVSLKAKLNAWVGKYRTTLARLPLQKLAMPCSADTRVKQLTIPAPQAAKFSLLQNNSQTPGLCADHLTIGPWQWSAPAVLQVTGEVAGEEPVLASRVLPFSQQHSAPC